jgi:hypothetical protein
MAIINLSETYGNVGDPQDLVFLRRQVFDYARLYGMPVIIKKEHNIDDVGNNLVERDNRWQDVYGQSSVTGTGFGTGIEGGFSDDGTFTFITLDETMVDEQTPDREGAYRALITSGHAPWTPTLYDGDLIILVEVTINEDDTVTITETGDRFRIQKVLPVHMRGYPAVQRQNYTFYKNPIALVSQNFEAVRMPASDPVYDVPVD